jgi:hypothetical protein
MAIITAHMRTIINTLSELYVQMGASPPAGMTTESGRVERL